MVCEFKWGGDYVELKLQMQDDGSIDFEGAANAGRSLFVNEETNLPYWRCNKALQWNIFHLRKEIVIIEGMLDYNNNILKYRQRRWHAFAWDNRLTMPMASKVYPIANFSITKPTYGFSSRAVVLTIAKWRNVVKYRAINQFLAFN